MDLWNGRLSRAHINVMSSSYFTLNGYGLSLQTITAASFSILLSVITLNGPLLLGPGAIVMAFRQCFYIFFDTPEVTKVVLPQKFHKILRRRQIVPVGPRN